MWYLVSKKLAWTDGKHAAFYDGSTGPIRAPEALREALKLLDDGVQVEIFDCSLGRAISFSELRKVIDAQGT
jgi:hypothetical protein